MDVIQQLKENQRPFGLMSEEMQEWMLTVEKPEDIEQMVCRANLEIDWFSMSIRLDKGNCKHMEGTFHLRPDYAEEPEIEECEIRTDEYGDLVYKGNTANDINIDSAYHNPDFIGFNADDWIWGCLYKNKKDPSMVHYMIKEHDLPLYDVISLGGGKVLFRRQK